MRLALLLLLVSAPAAAKSFPILSQQARQDAAKTAAASFPEAWHAKVEVDEVGMPETIELAVPTAIDDDHAAERVLEIVRDHAGLFGIQDKRKLHSHRDYADVSVGEGERWTGAIEAHYEGTKLIVRGHLWPIATPESPAIDRKKLLAPYVGKKGTAPSKCKCRTTEEITTREANFRVDVAVALVCKAGVLTPRMAIAIDPELGSAKVPALENMPRLLDATSRERITDDFTMPPYGAGEDYPRAFGSVQAHAIGDCFAAS